MGTYRPILPSRWASRWQGIGRRRARLFRFGANWNKGKANKYADYHQEEVDLHRFFASAVVYGTEPSSKKRSIH
jgi:hypothetical protein